MSNLFRNCSAPCPDFQNPVAIKPCIGIDRMSNQWKAELINDNFGIQSFWGGHDKILSIS
jgi:hypothetical protein